MSRNASGIYTLPAGNPVGTGTIIASTWANTTTNDIATALTDSLSRSGRGGMTAPLKVPNGSVGTPTLAFTNFPTSGLYAAGAGDIRMAVAGADVIKFLTTGVVVSGPLSSTGVVASGPLSSTAGDVNLKTNTALSDAAATLTAAQLIGGEFTITPTVARIQTTDTAVNIISALTGSVNHSNFEFTIINLAAFDVTIALGVGVTLVGNMVVNKGSATFRARRLTSSTVSITRLESGSGKVVQKVNFQTGSRSSGTVIIPFDESIPQNTEGNEFLTLAITPTDVNNKLEITVKPLLSNSSVNWMVSALFQDNTADALAVVFGYNPTATTTAIEVLTHTMTAGTVAETTFKFRAGLASAGTTVLNSSAAGTTLFGSLAASSITITEYTQ